MKGKGLKIWQAIMLVFSTICVAAGGVVLYTYFTNGFGNEVVEPEGITFVTDDPQYNVNTNQFEVDSSFSLTINATNEEVTEDEVTLSFAKTASSEEVTSNSFVRDGVNYISNGIVSVPNKVNLGIPFTVIIEQKQYNIEGMGAFIANVGGLTTIHAKSENILDSAGADVNIAVDVPVKEIELTIKDTTTGKVYSIDKGIANVLQNANFEILVDYFPATSRFRYSDQLYRNFHSAGEDFVVREKSYCYDITSGSDVIMNYNNGDIFFSSTGRLTTGNSVKVYVFETAKKQEAYEATNPTGEGEVLYNAMLYYLSHSEDAVKTNQVSCSVKQADVGNIFVTNATFTAKTNKLFTLTANNSMLGNGSLGLSISDTEGANLSSMISQVAIRLSYKKLGEADFTMLGLNADGTLDQTVVVKSLGEVTIGDRTNCPNPHVIPNVSGDYTDDEVYFFVNSSVKNLNNAFWEISTNEDAITIKIDVVLFVTIDGVTSIFDPTGSKLGSLTRTAVIEVTANEESDIAWTGNTREEMSIVYQGANQVPTQIDLSKKTSVPVDNVYQKVQYYVEKTHDESGEVLTSSDPAIPCIGASDANIDLNRTITIGGVTYALVTGNELLFKKAGTYVVVFVTIRTDAYGNIIYESGNIITQKTSNELTIVVSETLQQFTSKLIVNDSVKNGVFRKITESEVERDAGGAIVGEYYYFNDASGAYVLANNATMDFGGENYYVIFYYAIKTSTEDAITIEIEVAESDCTMINKELEAGNLKFYAISAATTAQGVSEHKFELEYDPDNATNGLNGAGEERIKNISFDMPEDSMSHNNGEGKGFYIVIEYYNTIEYIETLVEFPEESITENGKNCFMLYTPTPRRIENEILKAATGRNEYDVNVSMNSDAQYTNCSIYKANTTEELGDKEWLNDTLEETKVYDAYDRLYVRGAGIPSYSVRTSQGATAVYIAENEIEFASGNENVAITVSASDDCYYSFVLNTQSYGLKSVTAGGETFETFSNVHMNFVGQSGVTIDLRSQITIKVGVEILGDYIALSDEKENFYIKDISDANLLDMFEFQDASGNDVGALTTNTPIRKVKIMTNFAQNASLVLIVSNKANKEDPIDETIRFEFTINFTAYETATVNLNDKAETNDAVALTDGVYAGYGYTLENLITLEKAEWTSSSYGTANTYYISSNGDLQTDAGAQTTAVGTYKDGIITFYDVPEVTEYIVKLYYYDNNPYAYHNEAKFKVYPNITISKAVGAGNLDLIALVAGKSTTVSQIINYFSLKRVRGGAAISSDDVTVGVLQDSFAVRISESQNQFEFTGSVLSFDYNVYSCDMTLGLFLNGTRVKDVNNEEIEYNEIKVVVSDDVEGTLLPNLLLTQSEEGPWVEAKTVNYQGVTALNVLSDIQYKAYSGQKGDATKNPYYIEVQTNSNNVYRPNSGNWIFTAPNEGYGFGSDKYYVDVNIKAEDNTTTIASVKIPVYVSGVGSHYAYYQSYNPTIEGFDLQKLLYGGLNGEILEPFATFTAGKEIQIAYQYDDAFDEEGIYFDEGVNVSIKFENDLTECEYGRLLIDDYGYHYLHLANLANEPVFITLKVSFSYNTSLLEFTYRIKVEPNVETYNIYPFADGVDAAEYVTVTQETTYNLATVFGNYAGTKSEDTRFNLDLDTTADVAIYADTMEFYVKSDEILMGSRVAGDLTDYNVEKGRNDKYLIKAGTELYLATDDETPYMTTQKDMILQSVSDTETTLGVTAFRKVVITTAIYSVSEISVGGNSTDGGSGVVFDDFSASGSFQLAQTTGVTYTLNLTIEGEISTIKIMLNEVEIANAIFTPQGLLTLSNMNEEYFVNFVIKKDYINIVDGSLNYRLYINNNSGINYVEYYNGSDKLAAGESLARVETTISGNEEYNLLTKYTTGNGTSMADLNLSITATLKDRHEKVVSLDNALANAVIQISGTRDNNNGIVLLKNSSGNYTLNINPKTIINQNYTLEIYLSANSQVISTFVVHISSTLIVTPKAGVEQEILGGTTLTAWSLYSIFDISGVAIDPYTTVAYDSESILDAKYINSSLRLSSVTERIEDFTVELVVVISGQTYYTSISFDILPNLTPVALYTYGDTYYAGQTRTISINSFYQLATGSSLAGGGLSLADNGITIPQTYLNYFAKENVILDGLNIEFTSNNVAVEIPNVRVNLKFEYSFENASGEVYEYSFASAFRVTIKPNTIIETNYPAPTGNEEDAIEYESVYLGDSYVNFFGTKAPFEKDEDENRVVIKNQYGTDLTADAVNYTSTADNNYATVRVKDIYGVDLYALVPTADKNQDNINYYYTYDGTEFTSARGTTYNVATSYYYRFYPQHADTILKGLEQTLYFMPFGTYEDGYVVFEVEYNAVIAEYKVYAFDDIMEMEIVNSVNYVDGTEEIFLEQLEEGNILAEKMVAKINMGTLGSGTYYVKIRNDIDDDINPYNWVGFKYNEAKGNQIYVFLGQTCSINEDLLTGMFGVEAEKGDIIGIYASKTSTDSVVDIIEAVELVGFVNLKYRAVLNQEVVYLPVNRAFDYTSVLEAMINGSATSSIAKPLFKYNGGYATYTGSTITPVAIDDDDLVRIILGNYEVYDGYVGTGGSGIMVSGIQMVISAGDNGFGQIVEADGKLTTTSGEKDVYSFTDSEDEKVYATNVATIYRNAIKTQNVQEVELSNGSVIGTTVPADSTAKGIETNYAYAEVGGWKYYFEKSTLNYSFRGAQKYPIDLTGRTIYIYETVTVSGVNFACFKVVTTATELIVGEETSGYYRVNGITASNFNTHKSMLYIDNTGLGDFVSATTYDSTETYYVTNASLQTRYVYNCSSTGDYYVTSGSVIVTSTGLNMTTDLRATVTTTGGKTYITPNGSSTQYFVFGGELKWQISDDKQYYARVKIATVKTAGNEYIILAKDTDAITVFAKKLNSDNSVIEISDGRMFIVQMTAEAIKTACGTGSTVIKKSTSANVYKAKSTSESFNVLYDDTAVGHVEINGVNYATYSGKYIKDSDINTRTTGMGLPAYIMASVNTFNINNISSLQVDDSVEIKFQYIIGQHVKAKTFKFKLLIDLEVQNSVESGETNENAKLLTDENGIAITDTNGNTFNYIELEANKKYNFNELVGVIKETTGNVIDKSDVRSSTLISINVMEKDNVGAIAEFSELADKLGADLKDNEGVVRLSYELVKVASSANANVYNFNLTPLGADNNGDYVMVEYKYEIEVIDYVFKGGGAAKYSTTKYILFKILPDYNVNMLDANKNAVLITSEAALTSNKDNVVEITDFELLGDIEPISGKAVKDINTSGIKTGTGATEHYLIGGEDSGITYKFGYGKATATGSGQDRFTAVLINAKTYFVETSGGNGIGGDDATLGLGGQGISINSPIYENVLIRITNSQDSSSQMLKVTSKNSVNSLRDISQNVFTATLTDGTSEFTNIKTYLNPAYSNFNARPYPDTDPFIVAKNARGVRLAIMKEVGLGRRDFTLTLVDDYGYEIKFFFSLVAPSNPTYAAGSLEYEEGSTFDIGAKFEIVNVSSYKVKEDASNEIYYLDESVTEKTFNNGVGLFVEADGSDFKEIEDGDADVVCGYEKVASEGTKTLVAAAAVFNGGTKYYRKLNGKSLSVTPNVKVALNIPYGYGRIEADPNVGTDKTTVYISQTDGRYINVSNASLIAQSVSTIMASPRDPEGIAPGSTYVDTIELSGINAFGFAVKNVEAETEGGYFTTGCDLDQIKVTKIGYYCYDQGEEKCLKEEEISDYTLASSGLYSKYDSDIAMGRNTEESKYTIPHMPGWIFAEKDYAFVEMRISMKHEDSGETYTLPIEIKVIKHDHKIISHNSPATNVSDDTVFRLDAHITRDTTMSGTYAYYDDTIAVTLPAAGKVTIQVYATNISGEEYSGEVCLSSNYTDMDSTQYVGMSQLVGHTLGPNFNVTVTFKDYDTTKVTRNGNLGFYATYGLEEVSPPSGILRALSQTDGSNGKVGSETNIVTGSNLSFFNGYGKITTDVNENVGEFTALTYNGNEIIVPTERINVSDGGLTYTLKAGTCYVNYANFSENVTLSKSFTLLNPAYTTGTGSELEWQAQEEDKLNLVDMGLLVNGKTLVTKYYIAVYNGGECYQFVKNYNLYPKYTSFETDDVNNRVSAELRGDEDDAYYSTNDYYEFVLSSWSSELRFTYYDADKVPKLTNLGAEPLNAFYFEIGDDNTTSATIGSDGVLRVRKSEYSEKLNGETYVKINVYIKASGEQALYIDDTLNFSGNRRNKPMISIDVYLYDTDDTP